MKIASVVGARPNFVKLIPVHKTVSTVANHTIIHTGQHYDYEMSEVFFKEFNLPKPDFDLETGSGTACIQISNMIKKLEQIFIASKFDFIIVYGDTNSTFAGAFAAEKCGIKVAHVEAGLRSFDRRMPEETNRILTDHISEYLFAPTQTAVNNLNKENVAGKIIYSGDISVEVVSEAVKLSSKSTILDMLDLEPKKYVLCTMHRAENTMSEETLIPVLRAFEELSEVRIVFPIHPRTEKVLKEKNLYERLTKCQNVRLIKPVGYIDFIKLMKNAFKIITDSGGIQKESYLLAVPCITIRKNTEWVETVTQGWNIITDTDTNRIVDAVRNWIPTNQLTPIFGEGKTSTIIMNTLNNFF